MKLSRIQQQIVDHDQGPLLVLAGPGSGKTRVLTERVRRLLLNANQHFRVLALTFTNKAANEMRDRLVEFRDIETKTFIGTLHSFCIEVLSNRGKFVGIDVAPAIFERHQDRKQALLEAVTADPELNSLLVNAGEAKAQSALLDRWLNAIKECKNSLMLPELLDDPILRNVYTSYDGVLRASNALDFDDLLLLTYRLFEEQPKIAHFYRRQYPFICIDEAQDLNEAQYGVLKALCGSDHRNVMMVGDPRQAIFVFNGASPKYLKQFQEEFGATTVNLTENFRSSRRVVELARALYPQYHVEGTLPIEGEAKLLIGSDEDDEAESVAKEIETLLKVGHRDVESPVTLSSCALLGRNRYVFSAVERELNKRGWPYYKQLTANAESESQTMKDFELGLRLLANPQDQLHLRLLFKEWRSKNGHDQTLRSQQEVMELLAARAKGPSQVTVVEALRAVEQDASMPRLLDGLGRIEQFANEQANVEERALILEDVSTWRKHWDFFLRSKKGGGKSLGSFLTHVALGTTQSHRQDGIAILTVHSAKGLEFDVVFIMGMMEGTFPDYRATSQTALAEEQRNAFVAITRSRRVVILSFPRSRVMPWGDSKSQIPSRFLKTLGLI